MRIVLALLVLACCATYSSATLKLFKSKIKSKPLIYPAVTSYKPVTYLSVPAVVPEALPAAYARPVSTYSTHVSSYSVSLPSIGTYAPAFAVPQPYETTFAAPVVYSQPVTAVAAPFVHYHEPEIVYDEPFSLYAAHAVEELYDENFAKH